jgi:hypothetical protein
MRNSRKVGIKPLSALLSEITRDYIYLPMHGVTNGDDTADALRERSQGVTLNWRLSNQTVEAPAAGTYTAKPGAIVPDSTHMIELGNPNENELLNRIFNQSLLREAGDILLVGFTLLTHTVTPTSAEDILDAPLGYPAGSGTWGISCINSSANVSVRISWRSVDVGGGVTTVYTPSKAFAPGTEHQIVFALDHKNMLLRLFSDGDYASPVDVAMPVDGPAPFFVASSRLMLFGRKTGVSAASNLFNAGTSSSNDAAIHDFFACRISGEDADVVARIVREANANRYELPRKALAS